MKMYRSTKRNKKRLTSDVIIVYPKSMMDTSKDMAARFVGHDYGFNKELIALFKKVFDLGIRDNIDNGRKILVLHIKREDVRSALHKLGYRTEICNEAMNLFDERLLDMHDVSKSDREICPEEYDLYIIRRNKKREEELAGRDRLMMKIDSAIQNEIADL